MSFRKFGNNIKHYMVPNITWCQTLHGAKHYMVPNITWCQTSKSVE